MTRSPEYEPISSDELDDDPVPLDTSTIRPREDNLHATSELLTPDVTMGNESFVVLDYTHSPSPSHSVLSLDIDEDPFSAAPTTMLHPPATRQRLNITSQATKPQENRHSTPGAGNNRMTHAETAGDLDTAGSVGAPNSVEEVEKPEQRAILPFTVRYVAPDAPRAIYADMAAMLGEHTQFKTLPRRQLSHNNISIQSSHRSPSRTPTLRKSQ